MEGILDPYARQGQTCVVVCVCACVCRGHTERGLTETRLEFTLPATVAGAPIWAREARFAFWYASRGLFCADREDKARYLQSEFATSTNNVSDFDCGTIQARLEQGLRNVSFLGCLRTGGKTGYERPSSRRPERASHYLAFSSAEPLVSRHAVWELG